MTDLQIQIPDELFAPAESLHFEGAWEKPSLDAGPDTYEFADPIQWSVDIMNTGEALTVIGTCSAEGVTQCGRCLEEAQVSLFGEIDGYFIINPEESPEDLDDDEFDVLPESKVIDMEPLIVAALLMDLPLIPLCKEDCEGLCPTCGANLNEGPCRCDAKDEVSDMHPFAALKDFKFE